MVTQDQVNGFLKEFKINMRHWGILYRDDRGKNFQALVDLEMKPIDRDKVVDDLKAEDYCEGPLQDTLNRGKDMWVFGKIFKTKEIYIKITMGIPGTKVICISFHVAEFKLSYPFKSN